MPAPVSITSSAFLYRERPRRSQWRMATRRPWGLRAARVSPKDAPRSPSGSAQSGAPLEFQPDMPAPHPLTPLLAPSSVAIFGASNDPTRISGRSLRYYREAGYQGALYPINPTRDTVQGLRAFPTSPRFPGPVECAVIAVPANLAVEAMEACVAKGVKAVVMFTAGFAEIGAEGRDDAGRASRRSRSDGGIRLCGPNCLGLFNMRIGHTPTFSSFLEEGPTPAGPLGMVTQSGAFGTHLLALTARRGIRSASGCRPATRPTCRSPTAFRSSPTIPTQQRSPAMSRRSRTARVRRGGGARPRQRQAGHRDEGRLLDGRRRGGGLAHRLAGRRRRDLRRRLPPARRRARQDPGRSGQYRLCLHPRPAALVAPARGHDDVGRRRRADGRRRRGGRARAGAAAEEVAEGGDLAGCRSRRRATRSM